MSNEDVDYDKQFQADLERAQALSLETLALEKFRMQKQLKQLTLVSSDSTDSCSTPVDKERDEPTRSESFKLKSRPRPGTLSTVQPSPIIAPPPINQRKNSYTTNNKTNDGPDLISFTSPPSNSRLIDFHDVQKTNEMSTTITDKESIATSINQNHFNNYPQIGFHRQLSFGKPVYNSAYSQYSFQNGFGVPSIPLHTPDQMFRNQIATVNRIMAPQDTTSSPCASINSTNFMSPTANSSSSLDVLKILNKQDNSNLIDLATFNYDNSNHMKASVLEAFDPLCTPKAQPQLQPQPQPQPQTQIISPLIATTTPECPATVDDSMSVCSGSMYEEYDPFEYLHSGSGGASVSAEPIYATITRTDGKIPMSPPPLPPRLSQSTLERKRNTRETWINRKARLYENVTITKRRASLVDCDLKEFYRLVTNVRSKFLYNDISTNSGIVISPMMEHRYPEDISVKLTVYTYLDNVGMSEAPDSQKLTFTCNISSSVEHVTLHTVCEMDKLSTAKYSLKVWGLTEYLAPETLLSDYEYIHNCIKLEQDVKLCLVPDHKVDRNLARTAQDDKRHSYLSLTDLLPNEPVVPISHDNLIILLETLEREMDRVEKAAAEIEKCGRANAPSLKHSGVVQAVKAVCMLMGSLETPEITEALSFFVSTCESYPPQPSFPVPHSNFVDPIYAEIQRARSLVEAVSVQCNHIRSAVQALIEMYCQAFRVDFKIGSDNECSNSTIMISELLDWVAIRMCALHRLPLQWKHDSYGIEAQVYHGTRRVGFGFTVPSLIVTSGVNPRILFNSDLILEGVSFCTLARESRLVLILHGYTVQKTDNNDNNSNESQIVKEELAWTAFQFFNYEGLMAQGSMLLSLWPPAANRWIGPAPCPGTHPLPDHPVLGVELMVPHPCVQFPAAPRPDSPELKADFNSLDSNTQQQLLEIIEQDTLFNPPVEIREVLWEKRHYLYHLPEALPKVLLAAHSWDWASLANLHAMLHSWTPLPPLQALQLLLPCFPDMEVRRLAVEWLRKMNSDEIVDYLPQLVQALKHETYETSPLTAFLLEKSLAYPRVAHHLYWLLTHTLPGNCPQNTTWDSTCRDEASVCAARYHRRLQLMLRALLGVSGETLRNCLMSQQLLVKNLYEIAEDVKKAKESLRLKVLCGALESVHQNLVEASNCLPLSPSLRVVGVQVQTCSYFPSNTLPLKINFVGPDATVMPAIFKVGDDLQQDMLTLQVVRIMDKLWLREGLDLKMVTFACVPTGHKRGMIEMVSHAETLRKIQVELGLTGSFKDKPIAEWLGKHNPSELEYERARENFTASCAGYSVVTYILGICDRHNDNIMLKTSGHLFHIDFGKFLGDAQMFGNFKRDRTPFVLTSDMAFVINGGDRPSERFHKFVDLCCQAFNIVRANGNLILNLFTFMASSGIPGVTTEAVSYVRNALLPDKSNPEAAAMFARLIQSSLKSWFTQFNFFLHNLAQLRFTGDHGDGELLSFVPKTYTKTQEGRIHRAKVCGYEKRYDPDKYYVYILEVERENQPHPVNIFRTYKEFCELHQKLCLRFPLAKIHSLPTGIHMGRSNIKQVAEKRLNDIRSFVYSLFHQADEIAHSDLVYTFFHPLLRDQQNMEVFNRKSKARGSRRESNRVLGELKLTLHYQREALSVMVHHARSLPLMSNAQEPSTYVKVYLLPDATKSTKRKTKVVKRNCHPSFMEMLEYRLCEEVVKSRILQATVWNHDPLQENEFMGGVTIDLSNMDLQQEHTSWYSLSNVLAR